MIAFSSRPVIAAFRSSKRWWVLPRNEPSSSGSPPEPPDFGAQLLDDLLALVGALAEDFAEPLVFDVLGANPHIR